ncbi:MAG: exodeoxyribonuclease VII large subunit [Candidatus Hydrogenedentes bacterium]|nr:exodeoxyribonuclease VII large subunit [Candidatus Hydrogenedentota bacterium]
MLTEKVEIWTISQLTRRIKSLLETQVGFVWVSGEISNWKTATSGHAYFTLKDRDSQIDGVMFRAKLSRLRFRPENGLEVIVHGQVSVYEKRGCYQIVIEEMQPKGLGALQLAYEQLKRKLEAEGLFAPEHKKPLPLLPRRIGIVTSPTGAAIRDMLNVLGRRFANLHILIYPARVQGVGAAAEIVRGIRTLDRWGVDVMIIGRGGGSLEDLWAFNEEVVVRAVFEAQTPIISAVGHEIDFALSDFAADVRAPTPSAAAELVVREHGALVEKVQLLERRLARAGRTVIQHARHRLDVLQGSYVFRRPGELVRQRRQQADELRMRLEQCMDRRLQEVHRRLDRARRALRLLSPFNQLCQARERLAVLRRRLLHGGSAVVERGRGRLRPLMAQLDALSPLAILSRGYALAWKLPERLLVRRASELQPQDSVQLRFGEGTALATITTLEEVSDHGPS